MGMRTASEQAVFIRVHRYCSYLGKVTSLSKGRCLIVQSVW